MGFTLRATLDVLPPDATVVVAELVPAVVEWNRGPLGPLADHPLKDRARRRSRSATSPRRLRASARRFDAVLLDVDNGPAAFTATHNTRLYDDRRAGGRARGAEDRAACWRSGRRGTTAASSSACDTAASPSRWSASAAG